VSRTATVEWDDTDVDLGTESEQLDAVVSARVPRHVLWLAAAKADMTGRTLSDVIRQALTDYGSTPPDVPVRVQDLPLADDSAPINVPARMAGVAVPAHGAW